MMQPQMMSSLTLNHKSPSIAVVAVDVEQSRIGGVTQTAGLVDLESCFSQSTLPFSNVGVHKPRKIIRRLFQ